MGLFTTVVVRAGKSVSLKVIYPFTVLLYFPLWNTCNAARKGALKRLIHFFFLFTQSRIPP